MTDVRKVPASDGAEWLLGGIALLKRAPLTLGLLGFIWGAASALAQISGLLVLSLVMFLLGPILFAGMLFAAREVDMGRRATPAHLLQAMREGKGARLLAMLLPQIAALLLLALLLVAMFGGEQLQHIARVLEQMQANPDPELARTLPTGRILGWFGLAVVVGVLAGLFTFVSIPDVMFTARGAFESMVLSFRACLRNFGAILVLLVLMLIALFLLSLAVQVVMLMLGWLIGQQAALFIGQLVLFAIVLPVMAGTVYHAWRRMLGGGEGVVPPPLAGGIEA